MKGLIIVRNISEHTMVVMTHYYPLYNPRGETGWNKFMPYSGDPVTRPSATPASTNVNYMDDGTTGGYQGIIS